MCISIQQKPDPYVISIQPLYSVDILLQCKLEKQSSLFSRLQYIRICLCTLISPQKTTRGWYINSKKLMIFSSFKLVCLEHSHAVHYVCVPLVWRFDLVICQCWLDPFINIMQDKKGLGQHVCHDRTISYICVDKHYLFTGESHMQKHYYQGCIQVLVFFGGQECIF